MKKFLLGSLFAFLGMLPFHTLADSGDETTDKLDTTAFHCEGKDKEVSTSYDSDKKNISKNDAS